MTILESLSIVAQIRFGDCRNTEINYFYPSS